MNIYYFYKCKNKPMVIINLKSENGNSELRLGEGGYDQLEAPVHYSPESNGPMVPHCVPPLKS